MKRPRRKHRRRKDRGHDHASDRPAFSHLKQLQFEAARMNKQIKSVRVMG